MTGVRRRWPKRMLLVLALLAVLLIAFRKTLLSGLGDYLIATDPPEAVEAVFVLGGASYERGLEAVKVMQAGYADRAVCTGGNVPSILAALDTVMYEAEVTRQFMVGEGIPAHRIAALTGSTSTMEESEEILAHCQKEGLSRIMVISSNLHMRRVRWVFRKKFEAAGIAINFHGAPSQSFDDRAWWKSEGGLIMLNNEYVKLGYYAVKY